MSRHVGALIIEDGRVLLGRRTTGIDYHKSGKLFLGCYTLPAGSIEADQRLEDTAVLEAVEETGRLRLDRTRGYAIEDPSYGLRVRVLDKYPVILGGVYFRCAPTGGELPPDNRSNELVDLGWFDREQVFSMMFPRGVRSDPQTQNHAAMYGQLDKYAKTRRSVTHFDDVEGRLVTKDMPVLNVLTPVDSQYLRAFFL